MYALYVINLTTLLMTCAKAQLSERTFNSKTCCKRFDILIQNLLRTVKICQTETLAGNVSFTNRLQSSASNHYFNTRQMSVTDYRERRELTTHPNWCEGLGWVLLLKTGRPPDLNRRNPGHGPGILADKPEDRLE